MRLLLLHFSERMSTLYRTWGLTGAYAYRAYNDPQFLNGAIEIWEEFTPMVITTDDASTGVHPMKNVTFMSQCNNGEVLLSQRVIWLTSTHMLYSFRSWRHF